MGPIDISGLYYLAFIGMIAVAIVAIGLAIGVPWGAWWLFHHVRFI